MKLNNAIIAGAVLLASTFLASSARAVVPIIFTNTVTFSATALVQGTTNNNGTVTTVAAPTKFSLTTGNLLTWLAQDEFEEANFPSNSFPKGAQLVLLVSSTGNEADFQVMDKDFNLLVDVSDVINVDHGDRQVDSATVSDTTGLFDTTGVQQRLYYFDFDDTFISGGSDVEFEMTGLEVKTVKDTVPKSGLYTETVTTKITPAVGDGTYLGQPLVVSTGTISFSTKENLNIF